MPTITITTANICGNPIRARRAVRRRMRRALSIEGVTFGQEVARSNRFRVPPRGDYSTAWHRIAGLVGKSTYGGPHEVPISVPADYKVLDAESHLMHSGRRRVSPARYATIARTTKDGTPVAFVNCHTVSRPRRGVPFSRWRIGRFTLYLDRLSDIVAALHAEGYTVVFGGDMNHGDPLPRQIHPDQQMLASSGLDHLWIVPAPGMAARVTHRAKVARTALMDHPILTATVVLDPEAIR
jgi:hypothetical protein